MRKFTFFMSLALMALFLVPQNLKADDCEIIPDLFPGQSAGRTETIISATVKVGEWGPQNVYLSNHLINPLASTNENVVKTYTNGGNNAKVFFVGAGSADVTYTETIQRSSCTGVEQTIHYTVNKGTPQAFFAGQDGSSAITEYTAAYSTSGGGEDGGGASTGGGGGEGGGSYIWTPSCIIRIQQLYDDGRGTLCFVNAAVPTSEITFNSTNTAVATINASGQTTVNGLGTTVISATWPGNKNWEAVNIQYTLTVKKNPNLYFNPSLINDTLGKVIKPNVVCPEGVTISRWSSTDANIASVDNEGNVTLKLPGTVYISAIFDGNAEYAAGQCACQVTVAKADPHITFTPEVIRLEKNVDVFTPPVMNKPADLTETYSTTYQWSASDPYGVASVNAQTGEITLLGGTGTATIIYAFKGDVRYNAQNARYYIEVTSSGITVMGTYVTSANNGDVFGDGSVIYSTKNGEKNLTFTNINYDANGGIFLQSTSSSNLNIYVKGNCRVTNAAKGMEIQGPLYIWCENKKDSIFLNASNTALRAAGMKVIDCYLFANGGQYGIYTNDLAVWAGGYIFAEGTTEAIHTNGFTKGEASIGGIEALTKGVTFVAGNGKNPGGFFTDYEHGIYAHILEIGKVPLPVSNEEVKNIDFDGEGKNPYDNLDVVFSESEDDTFNDGESQIEINSTTDSETLESILSLYVTCSSEWLKALPGVLVFDVPQGEGKFGIQCEIAAGFHAEAFIEGVGEAKLDAPKDGWIELQYNVAKQTHVIIYLQADKGEKPAPARLAKAQQNAAPGMAIKSIKITPKDAATSIIHIPSDKSTVKMIQNGQLYIIRDGKIYNVIGNEVK